MPRRRDAAGRRQPTRDQETIRLINEALLEGDLKRVRQLAAIRGLVTSSLRRTVWPLLLGVDAQACYRSEPPPAPEAPAPRSARAVRDASTIAQDVARCLHNNDSYVGDHNREQLRARLAALLSSVVDGEHVHYYQGLHELAAVLLLEVGEGVAHHMLKRLVVTHLRDNTRAALDAVTETLQLVPLVIQRVDPRLARHLQLLEVSPYFSISWVITWLTHHVRKMGTIARFFDLFLASHPLMPLYVYTAGMLAVRDDILARDEMEDVHTYLVNLDMTALGLTVDELIASAVTLMHNHPPARLLHMKRCTHSCVVDAAIIDDVWWVPEKAQPTHSRIASVSMDGLMRIVASPPGRLLASVSVSALVAVGGVAAWLLSRQMTFESMNL